MVNIGTDRSPLDNMLADPRKTILILMGSGPKVGAIHDFVEQNIEEGWRSCAAIGDPASVSKPEEQTAWGTGADTYVVVGGRNKQVAKQGSLTELCFDNGDPNLFNIQDAFSAGDSL